MSEGISVFFCFFLFYFLASVCFMIEGVKSYVKALATCGEMMLINKTVTVANISVYGR
jgi:hypothetical protein